MAGAAAFNNATGLQSICAEFGVSNHSLFCEEGEEGLIRLASLEAADVVVVATTGTLALRATLAALQAGKTVALASKEIVVVGGELFMQAAAGCSGKLLPVDSEHNAIFQCLLHREPTSIHKVILTASGGPFLHWTSREMRQIRVADALRHPNWDMGNKITVDSATLANKGLELIEARWLFNLEPDQLQVVVHPQSIIHGMVEFTDGSLLAQMAQPDMTLPIQYAMDFPNCNPAPLPRLDFTRLHLLELRPPDEYRFPCLRLAREAMHQGGSMPAVFNSANQIAVDAFLREQIDFLSIPRLIESCMEHTRIPAANNLDEIALLEREALSFATRQLETLLNQGSLKTL